MVDRFEWLRRGSLGTALVLAFWTAAGASPWGAASAGAAADPTATVVDSVGLFDPGTGIWYLRSPTNRTTRLQFGNPGDIPLVGDWDGDGIDTPAVYRPADGSLVIRYSWDGPEFLHRLPAGARAVAGDWNGDGRDTVALGLDGMLFILDGDGLSPATRGAGRVPVPLPDDAEGVVGGDFDGDGMDEVAVLRRGRLYLLGSDGSTTALAYIGQGLPVAGDWDGDGRDGPAGYEAWRAQFRFFRPDGRAMSGTVPYGSTGMLPVAGAFGDLPGRDAAPYYRLGLLPMGRGATGPGVMVLQEQLERLRLYRGEINGVFDERTAYSVMTFHKVMGVERTYDWEPQDSRRMRRFAVPPLPFRPDEPDRVEVDIGRQVMFIFREGEIVEIVPVSTGTDVYYLSELREGNYWATTPRGDFHFYRHVVGWDYVMRTKDDVGGCNPREDYCVYSPWNFTPWYALHGYLVVPEYPGSRGCIRMTIWDADALEDVLFVGMPIHVWDEYHPPGPPRPWDLAQ
ncbi:MAG: murein L,D-transpeptidase [Actinobacteria bacterium]|nr:murein L,D-transpeptidase [Actinomycetota bacterium]